MKRGLTILFVAAALVLTSCTGAINPSSRDLEGINPEEPDTVRVFFNVDGYPNLNIICVDGIGFVTASHDGSGANPRELTTEAARVLCTGTADKSEVGDQ